MRNFLLIARREYVERVHSRTFLLMTIFIPALMFGVAVVPSMLISKYGGTTRHLVIAAADHSTAELIREEVEKHDPDEDSVGFAAAHERTVRTSPLVAEIDTDVSPTERDALTEKVRRKQIDGVIWASPEAVASRKIDFITREVSNFGDNDAVERRIGLALRRQSLSSKGLSESEIADALRPVDLVPRSPFGAATPNAQATFVSVFLMVMVLYTATLLYGINVMRAVLEEKTSRVMEVMLSTATAREMMAGKILGVGAVGLTQVAIWTATPAILLAIGLLGPLTGVLKGILSIKIALFFPLFFLLGYLLYSTLCAAVGSMVNSEQEAQQMQLVVMMPMILAVIVLVNIILHPGTPLSFWASMFPLTSPLIMFTRIALEPTIPGWQIALSLFLLGATIWGLLVLCGRIYRIGILMYGKKPTLPEIVKWIHYA